MEEIKMLDEVELEARKQSSRDSFNTRRSTVKLVINALLRARRKQSSRDSLILSENSGEINSVISNQTILSFLKKIVLRETFQHSFYQRHFYFALTEGLCVFSTDI